MKESLHREVMDRDKCCVLCGSTKNLDVHHFKDYVPGIGFLSAYENEVKELLDVLCGDHHGWLNGAKGKKNWQTRRALILYKFKIDIGYCRIHRYVHENGHTFCCHCGDLIEKRNTNVGLSKRPCDR